MRPPKGFLRLLVATLALVCLFTKSSIAQTRATTSTPAATTLQAAIAALTGTATVNDITLTGNAEWVAGADDETGTATYQALRNANHLALSLSSGPRNEIRLATGPTGSCSGSDGVSHPIAFENLLNDPGWFPLFSLVGLNTSSSTVLTFVGTEVHNGVSALHLSAFQQPDSAFGGDVALQKHLTQVHIFLDPLSLLPIAYVFNIHPDKNALLDIPVEVRYSNYQVIGGAQIPLHIQKYINNVLNLDLNLQNASLNTGLTPTQIGAQ
jgi:hypothetical protein